MTSGEDLFEDSFRLLSNPSIRDCLRLQKRFFNSYTWTIKSGYRLLRPKEEALDYQEEYLKSEKTRKIINSVVKKEKIDGSLASYEEIFYAIFNEIDFGKKVHSYRHNLSVPDDVDNIMLISGVLNEIFSTAAFERGAKHLKKKHGINYTVCKAAGLKCVASNAEEIKDQVEEYFEQTGKKVWVIAFSKGGLDFLHFMRKYPETANKCVSGLSTIASPILGSDRINHKIIGLINQLHRFSEASFYKKLDDKFDVLLKDFQESISEEFQEGWFKENFNYLPKDMFYSALALQSDWKDGHIWMILTKLFFQSKNPNDGIVDIKSARYPHYFHGVNLGILDGHHLIGTRTSEFPQEALLEAHIIFKEYYLATTSRPLDS